MTEQEAKGKWCPMYRETPYVGSDGMTYSKENRRFPYDDTSRCLASSCMMWQWNSYHGETSGTKSIAFPTVEMGGFCGLGGKP